MHIKCQGSVGLSWYGYTYPYAYHVENCVGWIAVPGRNSYAGVILIRILPGVGTYLYWVTGCPLQNVHGQVGTGTNHSRTIFVGVHEKRWLCTGTRVPVYRVPVTLGAYPPVPGYRYICEHASLINKVHRYNRFIKPFSTVLDWSGISTIGAYR
jgi:hypothetical protein